MGRFVALFLLLGTLSLSLGIGSYDVDLSFNDDLVGGRKVQAFISVIDSSMMNPYDGDVSLIAKNGKVLNFDGKVDGGLGMFDFVPDENATEVFFDVSSRYFERKFSFFSTPRKFLDSEDWYLVVKDFSGSVGIKRKGSSEVVAVEIGMKVFPGDEIYTMENSYVQLEGPNGINFFVVPNSVVRLDKFKKKEEDVLIKLKVMKGQTLSKILKKLSASSLVIVEAGGVTAGVRGTIFSMGFEGDSLYLRTFKGRVALNVMGQTTDVEEGKMAVFSGDLLFYIREKRKIFEDLRRDIREVLSRGVMSYMKRFELMEHVMNEIFELRARRALGRFGISSVVGKIDEGLKEFERKFMRRKRNGR